MKASRMTIEHVVAIFIGSPAYFKYNSYTVKQQQDAMQKCPENSLVVASNESFGLCLGNATINHETTTPTRSQPICDYSHVYCSAM
jgi:hypothetical protein